MLVPFDIRNLLLNNVKLRDVPYKLKTIWCLFTDQLCLQCLKNFSKSFSVVNYIMTHLKAPLLGAVMRVITQLFFHFATTRYSLYQPMVLASVM